MVQAPKQNKNLHAKTEQQAKQKEKLNQKKHEQAVINASKNPVTNNRLVQRFSYNMNNDRLQRMLSSSTMSLYASRLADFITKGWGRSNTPEKSVPTNTFVLSRDKIYTTTSVKMPLILTAKGDELPIGWLDYIRSQLLTVQRNFNRATNTQFMLSLNKIDDARPSDLEFSSDKRLKNDYKRMIESANFDPSDRKALSYEWLRDQDADDQASLWEVREFLELVVVGGTAFEVNELLHDGYDELIKIANKLDLSIKRMYMTVSQYNDFMSPIGHHKEKGRHANIPKLVPTVIREGKYIGGSSGLRQGSISDEYGVPVGIDINSENPIFIDFTDNNLPPSTLVTGTTGSGKTYLMESWLCALLASQEDYFPIVIDYKSEYVEIGRSAGMQIIDSSPGQGIYFDTMEIPSPTGDINVDERLKEASLQTTQNIFEILLGDRWNQRGIQEAFRYVRRSLYERRGVLLDDSSTWNRSKGLTFHAFYSEISFVLQNQATQAAEDADRQQFIDLRTALSDYFEKDGANTNYFKKPIRIEDIQSGRGVVFALNRKGETGNSNTDTRLMLTMQFIMHIINMVTERKYDKRLVPIYWEETNQLLLIPNIAEMISSLTTGGRSRGIRNFFITNSPMQIFAAENESAFSKVDPSLISTIMDNVGSIVVGPNSARSMKVIAEKYNMNSDTIKAYLSLLADQSTEDNSDNSALAHKFILRHRGKTTLIQAIANPALADANIFGTSVDVGRNTDVDETKMMKDLLERRNVDDEGNRQITADRAKIADRLDFNDKRNGL